MLRSSPARIREDEYSLSPSRSWLARALGIGSNKKRATPEDELAELERAALAAPRSVKKADAAKAKRIAELKALVDETLETEAR
jgi:hypothetical protein